MFVELSLIFITEVLAPILVEMALELGIELAFQEMMRPEVRRPVLAVFGWLAFGVGVGGLSLFLLPMHMLRSTPARLTALVVGSLAAGIAMSMFGRRRDARGVRPTMLATFFGGAGFAFGLNVVRLLWAE